MSQAEKRYAVFWAAPHNGINAGQVGASFPSESAAIMNFMKVYSFTKEDWEKGVKDKKYSVRSVMQ